MSGPRVVARVVDLPSMDEEELLAAVQQKVAELVPYPVADAVFEEAGVLFEPEEEEDEIAEFREFLDQVNPEDFV